MRFDDLDRTMHRYETAHGPVHRLAEAETQDEEGRK